MASAYSVQAANVRRTWLLIVFFVALVTAGCYALGWYYDNYFWPVAGLLFSLSQAAVGYFWGDKVALALVGARKIEFEQSPQIHNLVANIAKIAGIPKPKIYISPDQSANAFACGRNPEHASICLNQGILNLLDKNELEGVIAHEVAHIKNRDILVMTVAMVLASLVSFIADIGMRLLFWDNSRDRDNRHRSPVLLIFYMLFLILAPLVAVLIQMAISRSREYLADATAVVFTRYPQGLIRALQKLEACPVPTSNHITAMSHFYIVTPKQAFGQKVASLFSTHPPLQERIAKLQQMA